MITIQNADKALKDYYLEAVTSQLNDGISPFYSAIEKSTENVFGKDVKLAIVRNNYGSVVAGAEDGDLPEPYKNRYIDVTVPLKNIYGTIEISDKALRASKDNSGAFVNLVNAEMEGLVASAKQNFGRMLFGDGSGYLFEIGNHVSGAKYTAKGCKEYMVGMKVDIVPKLAQTEFDTFGLTVTAYDPATETVTFDREPLDTIDLSKAYNAGTASKDSELTGLGAIFNADTLYGHDKSTDSYFKPYKYDAKNKLTEDMLIEVLDRMEEQVNSKINMIICSYKTRRKIAKLISDNRRVVNSIDAKTGLGVVTVNDVPVYVEKYCPDNEIYFLNTEDFSLNQLCDWEWLEDENSKILKQIPGKAAYSATLVKYAELVCKKPCGQAVICNFEDKAEGASA